MKDTTLLNIIWILSSFFFLYLGLNDIMFLYHSFEFIVIEFVIFWYLGLRAKQKKFDKSMENIGDKIKGQWG